MFLKIFWDTNLLTDHSKRVLLKLTGFLKDTTINTKDYNMTKQNAKEIIEYLQFKTDDFDALL